MNDSTTEARLSLILRCSTPLFRPFFLGGLALLAVGLAFLAADLVLGRSTIGPPGGSVRIAGLGAFLSTFGFFLAMLPLVGRMPYRREVLLDETAGRLIRRDQTLVRTREEWISLVEIRGVEVENARFVDGDPDLTVVLRLDSGRSVPIDRFTDPGAAASAASLLRDRLAIVGSQASKSS